MTKVVIDPAGIAAVRTSIERVLVPRGFHVTAPFRTADEFPAYWRAAVQLHGSALAMAVASELPIGSFGRTSYAFASAATIGDALGVFRRDSQRAVTGLTTELDVRGKVSELGMHGPELLWPIFEILLGVIALRCRQLPEPPVEITRVVLPGPAPANSDAWRRVFTVAPQFDAGYAGLSLPTARLKSPLRTADAAIREALGTGPRTSIVDEVRSHLRAWIRDSPGADEVARALGMSVRTLQRRLREEQVTLRDLVLEAKVDVAKRLLQHEEMTISEISTAVGFSRIPAFSRAFLQRVGMSPTAFRASLSQK